MRRLFEETQTHHKPVTSAFNDCCMFTPSKRFKVKMHRQSMSENVFHMTYERRKYLKEREFSTRTTRVVCR